MSVTTPGATRNAATADPSTRLYSTSIRGGLTPERTPHRDAGDAREAREARNARLPRPAPDPNAPTLNAIAAIRAAHWIYRYPIVAAAVEGVTAEGFAAGDAPDFASHTSGTEVELAPPRGTHDARRPWRSLATSLSVSVGAAIGVPTSVLTTRRAPISATPDVARAAATTRDYIEFRLPASCDLRRLVLPPSFGLTLVAEVALELIANSPAWESARLSDHHRIFDPATELSRIAHTAWLLQGLREDLGHEPDDAAATTHLRSDVVVSPTARAERRVWDAQTATLDAVYLGLVRRVAALRSYSDNLTKLRAHEGLLEHLQRAAETQRAINALLHGGGAGAQSLAQQSMLSLVDEVTQAQSDIDTVITAMDAELAQFLYGDAAGNT